jgi:hypothetical protein
MSWICEHNESDTVSSMFVAVFGEYAFKPVTNNEDRDVRFWDKIVLYKE